MKVLHSSHRLHPAAAAAVACSAALGASGFAQQQPGYDYPPSYTEPPAYPRQGYAAPQYPPAPGYNPQPGYGYPQPADPQGYDPRGYAPDSQGRYVSPLQFLPTFGRKFGDMFRRLFYGDEVSTMPPTPGAGYAPPRGGALEPAPPPYSSHYGAPTPRREPAREPTYPPRYETPPAPRSSPPAMPPSSRLNTTPAPKSSRSTPPKSSATTPAKKYTPPSVTRRDSPPPARKEKDKSSDFPTSASGTKFSPDHYASAPAGGQSAPKSSSGDSGTFLKGKRTSKTGRVISPYPPYQELDVTGLSSGSLALDPTTQKVFEVP